MTESRHVSPVKAKQIILLGGLLLLEGNVNPRSVAFLIKSYLDLSDLDNVTRGVTVKKMSDNYGCTPQSGIKHVKELSFRGVLVRSSNHKGWKFNWDYLKKLNNLDQLDF